jgi:SAM-dependent methyltransferase
MGISKGNLALLCELKTAANFTGSICQLGRQTVFLSPQDWQRVAARFPIGPRPDPLNDVTLFQTLGFSTVHSLDVSDYEGATHVHDLNRPVPDALCGRYDAVYDGGTLEHVFDLPESLRNVHRLLKPGGLAIHHAPSHNHVDHGFYMFSPTLFHDWYRANGYEIVRSQVIEYQRAFNAKPWLVYEYSPGALIEQSFGGWGTGLLAISFAARKLPGSTCNVIPAQSLYVPKAPGPRPSLPYRALRYARNRLRYLTRARPPVVARY